MKLYEELEKQLKNEPNFVNDSGELKKWVVINKAQNFDGELIALLLDNPELKEKFFVDVKGTLVFNQNLFVQFLEQKNYLNDSYTQYKNKVGLTIGGKYLKQRNEVALVWPFKDCILEGGQSREEQKREEIFFNEILAQDEITQLLEPKVLSNAKVFDKDGEHAFSSFTRDAELNKKRGLPEDTITDNLIIKGNNLLALHSLKKEFAGKVKLIYIDPPYNTGSDSFRYNDSFNHSSWMTFMYNRLQVAKTILKKEGVIFIQFDDNEVAYGKVLCDDVFGRDNYCNQIAIETNSAFGFKSTSDGLFKQAGHILLYTKDKRHFEIRKSFIERDYDTAYKFIFDDISKPEKQWTWRNIGDDYAIVKGYSSKKDAIKDLGQNSFDAEIANYAIENAERVFRTASVTGGAYKKRKGTIAKSKSKKNEIIRHPNDDMDYMFIGGERVLFYKERLTEIDGELLPGVVLTDLWTDISIEGIAKEGDVKFERGKKPEELIRRIIEISTEEDDLVLDYFVGSGTTCAVAHKMNRQYIGIEQLEYTDTLPLNRLINVINGDSSGISKRAEIDWKGGGSFTYLELKKYNQIFIEQIEEAKDTKALLAIWEQMKAKSFLNYNVDIKKQEEHIEDFKALSLKKQKQHLCELLDKNQLYVNLSSLNDKDFECTDVEKQVTQDFYQIETK